jgi:hypothetical protein
MGGGIPLIVERPPTFALVLWCYSSSSLNISSNEPLFGRRGSNDKNCGEISTVR